jgi:hypothetical protein
VLSPCATKSQTALSWKPAALRQRLDNRARHSITQTPPTGRRADPVVIVFAVGLATMGDGYSTRARSPAPRHRGLLPGRGFAGGLAVRRDVQSADRRRRCGRALRTGFLTRAVPLPPPPGCRPENLFLPLARCIRPMCRNRLHCVRRPGRPISWRYAEEAAHRQETPELPTITSPTPSR